MDISLSAINAADMRLAVSANNVANVNTAGFKASRVTQSALPNRRGTRANVSRTDSGPDIAAEMIEQRMSLRYIQANSKVLNVQFQTLGTLLDLLA